MMGQQCDGQASLFYKFCLEDRVPADHLLRKIDRFLDLGTLRQGLAPFYSPIGRPSIDPELMIRILIVGYCFGIRSERRLCEEVDLNLAYRWFCRLGLEGRVPDHSTFSKTRHGRFRDIEPLRPSQWDRSRLEPQQPIAANAGKILAAPTSSTKSAQRRQRAQRRGWSGLPSARLPAAAESG